MYGIFVLTTLVVVFTSIIIPVVEDVFNTNPPPKITIDAGNKILLYLVLSLITVLAAPLMFVLWLSPRASNSFKTALAADLKKS